MKRKLFYICILVLFFSIHPRIYAQVDCDSIYRKKENIDKNTKNDSIQYLITSLLPEIQGGYDQLKRTVPIHVMSRDKKKEIVIVKVFVDTQGRVNCPRIVFSENVTLNQEAIKVAELLKIKAPQGENLSKGFSFSIPISFSRADSESFRVKSNFLVSSPLYVLNGEVIDQQKAEQFKKISLDQIKSIKTLSKRKARKKYGDLGCAKIIEIETK